MKTNETLRIGTAGWSAPRDLFTGEGSQLERYSKRFFCVEIDSSFYRPHRTETYARWAATTPEDFRFAVKLPRAITHEARLSEPQSRLKGFSDQILGLGRSLGPILVQLPPSLEFDATQVERFLNEFREQFAGDAVLEPRHSTWFCWEAEELLRDFRFGRVAADPACCPEGALPGGWAGLRYWRLHGSPRMYYTPYGEDRLNRLVARLQTGDWCIFDNTASGAAIHDALILQRLLQ